jgi:hypothetical protein
MNINQQVNELDLLYQEIGASVDEGDRFFQALSDYLHSVFLEDSFISYWYALAKTEEQSKQELAKRYIDTGQREFKKDALSFIALVRMYISGKSIQIDQSSIDELEHRINKIDKNTKEVAIDKTVSDLNKYLFQNIIILAAGNYKGMLQELSIIENPSLRYHPNAESLYYYNQGHSHGATFFSSITWEKYKKKKLEANKDKTLNDTLIKLLCIHMYYYEPGKLQQWARESEEEIDRLYGNNYLLLKIAKEICYIPRILKELIFYSSRKPIKAKELISGDLYSKIQILHRALTSNLESGELKPSDKTIFFYDRASGKGKYKGEKFAFKAVSPEYKVLAELCSNLNMPVAKSRIEKLIDIETGSGASIRSYQDILNNLRDRTGLTIQELDNKLGVPTLYLPENNVKIT